MLCYLLEYILSFYFVFIMESELDIDLATLSTDGLFDRSITSLITDP